MLGCYYATFRTLRLSGRALRLAKRSLIMYDTRIFVLADPWVSRDTSSVKAAIKSPNVAFLGNVIVIVIAF